MRWWDCMPWPLFFECWVLSQLLYFSSFTFIKRLFIFSSSSLSAIRVVSSAYLRLLIFLPAMCLYFWHWCTESLDFGNFSGSLPIQMINMCCHYCSVAKLCSSLCDSMDYSMPGFPVLRYLPEFAQNHVHCVSDATVPSYPLLPSSPFAFCLS